MNWVIPANPDIYDFSNSFNDYGYIDWRQGKNKFEIGNIIYIYCTLPIQKIQYKCRVDKINLDVNTIRDDKEYWKNQNEYKKSLSGKFMRLNLVGQTLGSKLTYEKLKLYGLNGPIQSARQLHQPLLNYIQYNFGSSNQSEIFPDIINDNEEIFEGIKKKVTVNRYERSSIAKSKCIESSGVSCKVCKMNFFERYGDIGKEFIHVHHVIPIHTIDKEYVINYKEDLIPVCPNCHAMLHRKKNGKEISVSDLIELFQSLNNTHK